MSKDQQIHLLMPESELVKPRLCFIGFVESGNPNSSQTVDEVVYEAVHPCTE